MTALIENIVPS